MRNGKPENLRSDDLYCFIMQYLALNTGKVITPSLITNTINKCLGTQYTTNKTVSKYLDEICKANIVRKLDREYIDLSNSKPSELSYNRTYYFCDFDLFAKFYDLALVELFRHNKPDALSHHIALAKMAFYHKCINAGYTAKSGVLSFFTHLENGKTKKNTLSFDFIIKNKENEIYVIFQNCKDFNEEEFTVEAKFALQNIINNFSILVVTTSPYFKPLEIDGFRYISLDAVLTDEFEI